MELCVGFGKEYSGIVVAVAVIEMVLTFHMFSNEI